MENLKAAIEAILFSSGDAVETKRMAEALEADEKLIVNLCHELAEEYNNDSHGINIIELDGSFQMCTAVNCYDVLIKLCHVPKKHNLTDIMLETLSIIAYKQPVTKAQIDAVRGIKSDRVLEGLMAKGLIAEQGRSTAIGRPYLYGTTKEFLKLFGFETLADLPEIENIDDLIMEEDSWEDISPDQLTLPIEEQ